MDDPFGDMLGFSINGKLLKCFTYKASVPSYRAIDKWNKEQKVKFIEDSF